MQDYYDIKFGEKLSTSWGGGNPNRLSGAWTPIADTRSKYCQDITTKFDDAENQTHKET